MDELLINQYLNKKGIAIIGQCFSYDKNMQRNDITSQVDLIIEFHKLLLGGNLTGLSKIKSTIGREVESHKVQIRKLQMHYAYISNKTCTNEIENIILSNGKIMLEKANKAINYIYEHDYFGVIKRSMNREEICLGKVDKSNLRKNNEKIEVCTIKGMTYNLVEEDLYNYIKKLQRKEINIDEEELIKLFVHGSHLSISSFDYLRGLCSYPKDFLRFWERYRDSKNDNIREIYNIPNIECTNGKKAKNESQLLTGLKKSLKYESKNFII
ncbi:spore coat protein [Clostridium beijerinckii]|uniref:spore coat protein n=1 Tax=Clostridium beijerinckii TaxID=1520 RepID=UPI00055BB600|nr:spore coat protein [Clostridium beijerinckii]